ncbi:MAG: sigma-54-dependent Fis family transcriptional regulator [Candidatus Aminicenantes bacterium]|nr:sigma-54-dependent Fis family transcriptional regulator [Candidatus Aminicenantes bacterium]
MIKMTDTFKKKLLYVDDEKDNIGILQLLMKDEPYEVVGAFNGKEAIDKVKSVFFSVILLDIRMPGMDGMQVLEKLKEESPQSLVIILSAYGSDENRKKALKADVFDFVDKYVDNNVLLHKVQKAFQHSDVSSRSDLAEKEERAKFPYKNIIGGSPKIKEIFEIIKKVAPTDVCVSITGETGTGKELVARAIHAASKRSLQPFMPVNAGALPETLLETTLFGYEKGAFTDAKARRFGYFESCKNGTIFLDEIGDISPKMQASLLRVLQEKKIMRVGGSDEIDVDARVITATNKYLEKLVEAGTFRQDLYYRIKTVTIHLPPLRERRDDIKPLVEHFLGRYSNKDIRVSDETMAILMDYNYPGNIRELEHIIERALIFQEKNIILPKDLPPEVMGRTTGSGLSEIFKLPWEDAKIWIEKLYIEAVLEKTEGNVSQASKISGIDRSYLHKQIKKYGIKK